MRLSGLSFRGFYPTRPMSAGRAARSVIAPYRFPAREICLLPRRFAPDNANIIANNQPCGWRITADLRLREIMVRTKSRRMCRAGAEGVFRRNAISRESPVHQRQVGGLEPTVAREHVCGPDVISTATVNGAREGARVEIMSVGCPQTAGRASRSGQVPDYPSRNIPAAGALPV